MQFIDRTKIIVKAGDGGHGKSAFTIIFVLSINCIFSYLIKIKLILNYQKIFYGTKHTKKIIICKEYSKFVV